MTRVPELGYMSVVRVRVLTEKAVEKALDCIRVLRLTGRRTRDRWKILGRFVPERKERRREGRIDYECKASRILDDRRTKECHATVMNRGPVV